jgi:hypothetical protein
MIWEFEVGRLHGGRAALVVRSVPYVPFFFLKNCILCFLFIRYKLMITGQNIL